MINPSAIAMTMIIVIAVLLVDVVLTVSWTTCRST
jgi:hypothetical protein